MRSAESWIEAATKLFEAPKPEHFTDYLHCCECAEHDETLRNGEVDSIGMDVLGSPGWDPICFASAEGKKYYVPAFVRLTLQTIKRDCYLDQFLFHLEGDGPGNDFYAACTRKQRQFIAGFIVYLIEHYPEEVETAFCTDDALRVHEMWAR